MVYCSRSQSTLVESSNLLPFASLHLKCICWSFISIMKQEVGHEHEHELQAKNEHLGICSILAINMVGHRLSANLS